MRLHPDERCVKGFDDGVSLPSGIDLVLRNRGRVWTWKKRLAIAAYGAFLLLTCSARSIAANPSPNFVLIFIDDLGFADISAFGQARYQTPNLDRMAREGRRFTSFYVAASVCTPSRAGLMTGSYPARVDMLTNDLTMDSANHAVLFPGDRKGLNPDEVTVAEMLQERGYATTCIGKWHLGDQPPLLPTRQGFEEYFGIPFSNDMAAEMKPFFVPAPLVRGERVVKELEESEQDLLTQRYTEEALGFIERNALSFSICPTRWFTVHTTAATPSRASPARECTEMLFWRSIGR